MSKIHIDYREHKIIDILKSKDELKKYLEIINLDIGDIHLVNNEYTIIIERKSLNDLVGSVKDGRYKEQKLRLQSHHYKYHHNTLICYLIEGNELSRYYQKEDKLLYGTLISLTLRDKIPIFRTDNVSESITLLVRLFSRLKKQPQDFFNNIINNNNNPNHNSQDKTITISNLISSNNSIHSNNSINNSINSNIDNENNENNENSKDITIVKDIIVNKEISNNNNNGNNNNSNNNNDNYDIDKTMNKNIIVNNGNNGNNGNGNNLLNNVIVNKNKNEVRDVKQINVNLNYLETVKVNKKSNITPDNWFLLALRNIPGVSVKIANTICNEYNSIDKLLSKYKQCETVKEKEVLLASLKIIDGQKKIGNVLSKKIYNFINNISS